MCTWYSRRLQRTLRRKTRNSSKRHLTAAIGYGSSRVACRRPQNHQRLSRVHYRAVRSLCDIRHRLFRMQKKCLTARIPNRKSWFFLLLQRLSLSPKWPCGAIWLVQPTAPSHQRSDRPVRHFWEKLGNFFFVFSVFFLPIFRKPGNLDRLVCAFLPFHPEKTIFGFWQKDKIYLVMWILTCGGHLLCVCFLQLLCLCVCIRFCNWVTRHYFAWSRFLGFFLIYVMAK